MMWWAKKWKNSLPAGAESARFRYPFGVGNAAPFGGCHHRTHQSQCADTCGVSGFEQDRLAHDSGSDGAEALLGQGRHALLAAGYRLPATRAWRFCVRSGSTSVIEHLKSQGEANYIEGVLTSMEEQSDGGDLDGGADAETDPLYDQAVAVVLKSRRASISFVQRDLRIGYNRAARLIEQWKKPGS